MSNKNKSGCTVNLTIPLVIWLAVFITLKVTNVVAWSWGLVLLPLWIGLAFWIPMALMGMFVTGITSHFIKSGNYKVEIKDHSNETK